MLYWYLGPPPSKKQQHMNIGMISRSVKADFRLISFALIHFDMKCTLYHKCTSANSAEIALVHFDIDQECILKQNSKPKYGLMMY